MSDTTTQQNDLTIRCSLGAGIVTIDAEALPRETVQKILALIFGLGVPVTGRQPPAESTPPEDDARARAAVVKALNDVAAILDPECARVVVGRADAFRRGERSLR